ncbi:MAG: thiamine phosphate synthase [Planctomycetota bacterium]|nr:thiamine phosphate synthase [Planctomycetota bacterium]
MSFQLPPLYLISDAERVGEDRLLEAIQQACRGGLGLVQLREPSWNVERLESLALRLQEQVEEEPALVVNCHPGTDFSPRLELVERLGARGVHVGGGEPGCVEEARKILGEAAVVGYSAHSPGEAAQAFTRGANYVSLSPVFMPLSKQGDFEPLGLEQLSEACSFLDGPVYALGGIRVDLASSLRHAGAAGAAVVSALLEAEDPAAAAAAFLGRWEEKSPASLSRPG